MAAAVTFNCLTYTLILSFIHNLPRRSPTNVILTSTLLLLIITTYKTIQIKTKQNKKTKLKISIINKIVKSFLLSKTVAQPIRCQCTLSMQSDKIRKPYAFLMFSGGRERLHWDRMV